MKKLDYVYFTIYHHFSCQSCVPYSLVVRLKCMYLLAISTGGWILFLQALFLRFVRVTWFASHAGAMINALSIYFAVTFMFYRIFITEEKDQKIFDKYVNAWENNPNKRRDLFFTSFVAAMPYISMTLMKILLPRQ